MPDLNVDKQSAHQESKQPGNNINEESGNKHLYRIGADLNLYRWDDGEELTDQQQQELKDIIRESLK